jgi:hypothetical protein
MPIILAPRKLRQKDCEFKASMGYILRSCHTNNHNLNFCCNYFGGGGWILFFRFFCFVLFENLPQIMFKFKELFSRVGFFRQRTRKRQESNTTSILPRNQQKEDKCRPQILIINTQGMFKFFYCSETVKY